MVDTAPEFKITDGTGPVTVDGSVGIQGQLDDVSTVPATEDNLATARITAQRALHTNPRNSSGVEIGTAATPFRVDPTGTTTQPISAVSLPLPTGASTAANQATANTTLASIDARIALLDDVPAGMNDPFVKANPIAGQLDDTSTTAATENNVAPVRITAQRAMHVNLRSNNGTEAGTSGNPLAVSIIGSITATSVRDDQNQQIINGNAYNAVLSTSFTINNTETNALYLKNNSGSKTLYIFNLFPYQDPTNGNNWFIFRAYFNPTVSANGTSVAAINMVAGSSNTSSANCYSGPTVSARGTMFKMWPSGINNAASPIQDFPFPNYIVIPPSQSMLVTAQSKANGQGMYADIMWYEV